MRWKALLAAAATALATPTQASPPTVLVDLLTSRAPNALRVDGAGRTRDVVTRGDALVVDGRPVPALELPAGRWTIRLPGAPPRRYAAALAITADAGRLAVRATYDLERYVAAVVSSEAGAEAPPAALRALAVVVRSYARSARGPHPGGARCDLAHCQLLAGRPPWPAAIAAARATAGQVLRLAGGRIAAAHFHAACGGHTADPRRAFGGDDAGSEAAVDAGCPEVAWTATLSPEAVSAALRRALARAGDPAAGSLPASLRAADLAVAAGPGGWIAQVGGAGGGWRLSGDAAARALDAAVGRGRIRSSRFTLGEAGGLVSVRGRGHGHGVGLCQAGAARRARAGADHRAILGAYFPGATLAPLTQHGR